MTSATDEELIVDADGHVCEPADLWERRVLGALVLELWRHASR
ncbi:MAG: hypothetical protein VX681_12700 [Myxococcota bacterium]|nr:hypothetical protein [Myxococcota bacterium]